MNIELPISLNDLFNRYLNSDFNNFKNYTGGIVYMVEKSGQLTMLFMETLDDLSRYSDKCVIQINKERDYYRPIIEE